jgi:hypothetical protein
MKLVHHNTGEWIRSKDWTAATRTDPSITEYAHIDEIDNAFIRDTFAWMIDHGMSVTQCGSDTFQIRSV